MPLAIPSNTPKKGIDNPVHGAITALYVATIFLGSALIFAVQPMFAKAVLPALGGSPSVWNTAMLFFQAALLAGYFYAHLMAKLPAWIHPLLMLLGALLVLPLTLVPTAPPSEAIHPALWMLHHAALTVGLPFLLLSAGAPLIQAWYARLGMRSPYGLYAASNVGSLGALLAYPFLIEPAFTVNAQAHWWSTIFYGYLFLVVLSIAVGFKHLKGFPTLETAEEKTWQPPNWQQRGIWTLYAFVPSSLMLGVTTYATTDLASIPLFWVVPLALYLLTFVISFSTWGAQVPMAVLLWAQRTTTLLALLSLAYGFLMFFGGQRAPISWLLVLHISTFFLTAWRFHGLLFHLRPHPTYLTEFYFWLSIGGVLGGLFNTLIAPFVFPVVWEYPAVLLLSVLLGASQSKGTKDSKAYTWLTAAALTVATLTVALFATSAKHEITAIAIGQVALLIIALFFLTLFSSHRIWSLATAALFSVVIGISLQGVYNSVIYQSRSFFGEYKVMTDPKGQAHLLMHGTTLHGIQMLAPDQHLEMTTYYSTEGPLGDLFTLPVNQQNLSSLPVAAVGLGAGTVACHGHKGQTWDFYEIDPEVAKIATDARYFTFLQDCPPTAHIILGDGRLRLEQASKKYGIIILDTYSSDSIPVHLMTQEAYRTYLNHLAPDGILAIHVTNRHLNVVSVLASLAEDAGLTGIWAERKIKHPWKNRSKWVFLSRKAENFSPLITEGSDWKDLKKESKARLWTDKYSNIWDILK